MSDEISKVAIYDPANPYSILNPNAAPYVIGNATEMAKVPSYESMLLDVPAEPAEGGEAGRSLKQKAAAAVLLATGGIKPTEPPARKEELPPPKPKEPKEKKRFFSY